MLAITQDNTKEVSALGFLQKPMSDVCSAVEGQLLPKEASFSSLFTSMFSGEEQSKAASVTTSVEPANITLEMSVEEALSVVPLPQNIVNTPFVTERVETLITSFDREGGESYGFEKEVVKDDSVNLGLKSMAEEFVKTPSLDSNSIMVESVEIQTEASSSLTASLLSSKAVYLHSDSNGDGLQAQVVDADMVLPVLNQSLKSTALAEPSNTPSLDASLLSLKPVVQKVTSVVEDDVMPLIDEVSVELMPVTEGVKSAIVSTSGGYSLQAVPVSSSIGGQAHWGAQQSDAQHAAMSNSSQSSSQNQNSQNGQGAQGQFSPQQNMMFAQAVQEQRQLSTSQQAVVKSVEDVIAKADVKELTAGGELLSTERRGSLPVGLQAIAQPVKHPQWGQALGQRVVFMANSNLQKAQITLNPEKLGHIQVILQLDKDNMMNVSLTAQNGTTREAMEGALPKLREMLEQSGVTLGSMDVSDDRQSTEAQEKQMSSNQADLNANLNSNEASDEEVLTTVKTTDNIVDYYA